MTGSASGHAACGSAEEAHIIAHETLAVTEPAEEGQRPALISAVMSEGMPSETSDEGRKHGAHAPALHEVPSWQAAMLLCDMCATALIHHENSPA